MEVVVFSRHGSSSCFPAWPQSYADGTITDMLVRGGNKIDVIWEDRKLSPATLYARTDGPTEIKY